MARFASRPLSDAAGVEIAGIDLSRPLDAADKAALLDLFRRHHVLVFRDQALTPEHQAAFTRQFGDLEEHVIRQFSGGRTPLVHVVSNLDAEGNPTTRPLSHGNYFWHTDKSYHAIPSLATILHAIELPAEGGDTQYCNTAMAHAALSPARQREIGGLSAVHSWEASRRNTGNRPASPEEIRERPPVTHPLVRRHPETGAQALYLGMHVSHVVGMAEAEGRALLDDLLAHATAPRFVYTHRWQPGDVVMWDNRCLLHRAVANYGMDRERRVLHRTVVKGTAAPVA